MALTELRVNDLPVSLEFPARTSLADLLREHLGLTGTHVACEHGVCGACTVLLDEKPVRSCIVLAAACEDRHVRTIEGFESDRVMSALRDAFKREHGLQCGFCTPGMLVMARDIAIRLHQPDGARIRRELSGNLCRCTGYVGIIKAVQSVASMEFLSSKTARPLSSKVRPVRDVAGTRTVASMSVDAGDDGRGGWTRLTENFAIDAEEDTVWAALLDIPFVASCLPGAEILESNGDHVKGRVTLKLGPMRAAMIGSGSIVRDTATRTAELRGGGTDRASGSRTQAKLVYSVKHNPAGAGSLVEVAIAYNIQGPLAQFSRSGVTQEVGRLLIRQFAGTLNRRLRGDRSQPKKTHLSIWSLVRLFVVGGLKRVLKR